MQHILDGWLANGDGRFSLTYDVGNTFSGQTHLELHRDGRYFLWSSSTADRVRREFAGQLPPEEVRALLLELVATRFWTGETGGESEVSDDTRTKIALREGEKQTAVSLWLSALDENPGFGAAQHAILARVRALSLGAVLETGT